MSGNLSVMGLVSQRAVAPEEVPDEDKDAERVLHEEAMRYIERWKEAEEELASLFRLTLTRPIPTLVKLGGVIEEIKRHFQSARFTTVSDCR